MASAAPQPKQNAQDQAQAKAEMQSNKQAKEQAHYGRHRDRDDYYWDDGWYDDSGRYYRYHHCHDCYGGVGIGVGIMVR